MIVDIPENTFLFKDKISQEVYLVINKAKVFSKDTEVLIIKKVNEYKNQELEVIPKIKFDEGFEKLKSIA